MNIALLVDIGVIVVLLLSAGISFFRGLIREVLTIIGVLGGGFAALTFGSTLLPITSSWFGIEEGKDAGKLFDLIPMELAAQITAYAGIFVLVFVVLQLASYLISSAVQATGLGPIDRTLGIFFGLARGVLLLGIIYLPFHLILPDDNKKEWLSNSKTMVMVEATTRWITSFLPQDGIGKDDKTTESDSTINKIKGLDILGEKRITEDEKDKANSDNLGETPTGYTDKAREGLENLIEKKIETDIKKTGKNYNE